MISLNYNMLKDKIMGGWYGKCLGGTIGCFEGTKRISNMNIMDLLPDKMVANDDLDIQLVWMDVLLSKGIYFTSDHLMQAWINQYDYNFGEYSIGRRNFNRGIHPPMSGKYANLFFANSMGCPIRSEIWGMIAPGDADLAASYAYKDGILDHDGESVWSEQFLAAIEAQAFVEDDLQILIQNALKFIPVDSLVNKCIHTAIEGWEKGQPWHKTWKDLRDQYGHPDCTFAPQNIGITVMALLYGGLDFDRTLTITANAAWDVDCTCSTVAAVLGIMTGYDRIDRKWLQYVGEDIVTLARPEHDMSKLSLLTEYTLRAVATLQNERINTAVWVEDIPDDLERLPTIRYEGPITLEVNYCGKPVILVGEEKHFQIYVQNRMHTSESILLRFSRIPPELSLSQETFRLVVNAGETVAVDIIASVRPEAALLPDRNILELEAVCCGKVVCAYSFGICGAPTALVTNLYYDTYMDWLRIEDIPEERLLRSNNETIIIPFEPEEWGNHRVSIEKQYLPEEFGDIAQTRAMFQHCKRVGVEEDCFILKDAYGFRGSACVYYYEEIFSEDVREVDLFVGSSDPFKMWLSGEIVAQQVENRFWYPYQHVVTVKLNKGCNPVVIKIARTGEDNRLSMTFRHKRQFPGFDSAANLVDLSFATFQSEEGGNHL